MWPGDPENPTLYFLAIASGGLRRAKFGCFLALAPFGGLVLDLLALLKAAVAFHFDVRMMDEKIISAIVGGDKPITLLIVKPLNSSGIQRTFSPGRSVSLSNKMPRFFRNSRRKNSRDMQWARSQ